VNEIYKYLQQGDYNTADKITRAKARQYYLKYIAHIDYGKKLRIIDEITGGLGYKGGELNILEMNFAGVIISWVEVVKSKPKVLEVGTGLGRTCFIVVKNTSPSLYLSLDKSLTMLAIALFSNPIKEYMQALNSNVVKVAWADALKAVDMIPDVFDHIIHDGGPNPNKNPRLYSESFLAKLARVLTYVDINRPT